MWTTTKRVIKTGFIQFWRSSFVSISSIFIMVITLSVILSITFASEVLRTTLTEVRNRVDINVYFVPQAEEAQVRATQTKLEALPEVASVEYISREQALIDFRERNKNDSTILQSLDEIGDNPFGAVLNVRATDPSKYEIIDRFLESQRALNDQGPVIIDKVNYEDNKVAIDRLSQIISASERFGLVLMIALVILSIVVTFNTIRLAIYISKDEISVMKLVGASNKYIRGPFVVAGIICGVLAAIITLGLYYPLTFWLGTRAESFVGVNLFTYYISNFPMLLGLIGGSAIAIGAISSWLAVRKYLS
jgi:cell division transport system permease protein